MDDNTIEDFSVAGSANAKLQYDDESWDAVTFTPLSLSLSLSEKNFTFSDSWYILPTSTAWLFTTVLEDAITQFYILENCNSDLRVLYYLFNMKTLKSKKYGVEAEPWTIDNVRYPLDCPENKLNKIEADRAMFIEFMKETYSHLCLFHSLAWTLDKVDKIMNNTRQQQCLQETVKDNNEKTRELKTKLRQQRNAQKTQRFQIDEKIAKFRETLEDVETTHAYKESYAGKWNTSRQEMHELTLHGKHNEYEDKIKQYKLLTLQEYRAHAEVVHLYKDVIATKYREIDAFMAKYEDDIEEIDLKIQVMRNDYKEKVEIREMLNKKFNKHKREIQEWTEFTEKRTKERLYRENMQKSAAIIQAWWRGLLVRLKYGPYRPNRRQGHKRAAPKASA